MRDGWDDDRLLTALSEAIKAREAVPSWFIETGKNAFAWHNIDAELAQLTYDSNEDRREAAVMRSETALIRSLTFTSAHLSLELEVTGNSLLGQLLPQRAGTLEIHTRAGEIGTTEVDEIGRFAVDPIPDIPFRLRCRTADGTDVLTGWITILGVRLLGCLAPGLCLASPGLAWPPPDLPGLGPRGGFLFCPLTFRGIVYQTGLRALRVSTESAGAGGTRGLGRGPSSPGAAGTPMCGRVAAAIRWARACRMSRSLAAPGNSHE